MKKVFSVILCFCMFLALTACSSKRMKMVVKNGIITIQNEYILASFNESNGSINTIYNKTKDLYLVKDASSSVPISLLTFNSRAKSVIEPKKKSFSYKEIKGNKSGIELSFSWSFENGVIASSTIKLDKDSVEILFNVKLDNLDSKTLNVRYPIVNKSSFLDGDGSNDYLLTSFATGYIVKDPIHNMTKTFTNFTGDSALYPYGFGSTMQFMSYYSKNKGGFHFESRDSGDTIKAFEVSSESDALSFSVSHYIDNLSFKEADFSYDTSIKNLYEGNWYEAAEIYRDWAVKQSWCTKRGKNSDRTDLNKTLFEKTTLSNFVLPTYEESSLSIYNKVRSLVNSNQTILNFPWYGALPHYYPFSDDYDALAFTKESVNQELLSEIKNNNDLLSYFEYTDLEPGTRSDALSSEVESLHIKDYKGNNTYITFGTTDYYYYCSYEDYYSSRVLERQKEQLTTLNADGLYNDVGLTAIHPLQCFDSTHSHGTRINITTDFYELMDKTFNVSRSIENKTPFVGQEMITEKIIPYVDYYQTRSASGYMGEMEHEHIMPLLKIDAAYKIPLFEYIYSEYVGMRLDGFTLPFTSIGDAYYYIIAYCILNGYIAQYNYENTDRSKFDTFADNFDEEMVEYLSKLGDAKITYGKDYLNYPIRVRTPESNTERVMVDFDSPILANWQKQSSKTGKIGIDPVVSSAYKGNSGVAIFLINVLSNDKNISFTIDANSLYGINNGEVSLLINGENKTILGNLIDGKIKIDLKLNSRDVYMIEITNNNLH